MILHLARYKIKIWLHSCINNVWKFSKVVSLTAFHSAIKLRRMCNKIDPQRGTLHVYSRFKGETWKKQQFSATDKHVTLRLCPVCHHATPLTQLWTEPWGVVTQTISSLTSGQRSRRRLVPGNTTVSSNQAGHSGGSARKGSLMSVCFKFKIEN